MSARPWLITSALTVAAITLVGCAQPAPELSVPPVAEPVHWSYDGASGPPSWAKLDPGFAACAEGTAQSPIDLPATVPAPSTVIQLSAENAEADVFDTGHAVEFEADGEGETLTLAGDEYSLQQLHAHVPSEHTVNGQPAAAELHLVHADAAGKLLVLGILVTEGPASDALAPFIEAATHVADDEEVAMDISAVLPPSLANYEYSGSLTTPPCTEDVQWVVMSTPISMSAEQIGTLERAHSHNARPTQPLGGRDVVGGAAELGVEG
ncbi:MULTISPECIES: carbonic anhydrase family protein [Cryobacterium]|uniref:carbonic anhydrase n=1 Tax=Cryobacterium breve TaxID=1259258 RepID=A0ABY2JBL9_9MICO|nr:MULTISPECIES: carbonic anhydrase family protein [Cryobacterium]TFC91234.1 carbonic anhydrase family protein [Cryobacterium sp. TmT3-12]TFD01072.1 carbonic anhydrase family protein [Cryobacterium breve]